MSDYDDHDIGRARRRRIQPTSLMLLLEEYNAMLGWTQNNLAKKTGLDSAQINKIFTGVSKRPHRTTLEAIAAAYQEAGLNVTADFLTESRDYTPSEDSDPYGIPAQWLRLVRRALAYDEEIQDSIFSVWRLHLDETAKIIQIARSTKKPPTD